MPRTKTVTLGGMEYEISQLPMRPNKEWRDSLGAPVLELINLIQGFGDLELKTDDLMRVAHVVKDVLLGSMDILLDALFRYSPTLAADRERIESESFDDEAIATLGVIIGLAYPLDALVMPMIHRGSPATAISMNSRSANGASGTKKHSAERQRATSKT